MGENVRPSRRPGSESKRSHAPLRGQAHKPRRAVDDRHAAGGAIFAVDDGEAARGNLFALAGDERGELRHRLACVLDRLSQRIIRSAAPGDLRAEIFDFALQDGDSLFVLHVGHP
ncbi:MAG: hypothetical protein SYC29_04400 [Planctomycetota bacterium]|nr:hypothetical protein [Planctomycetota bacterium]